MSTIVTRSGKGSPLTHTEVDANFTNLNTDKYQEGSAIGAVTPAAGTFTTLTATGQTSLGGATGSESFRVVPFAGSTRWVQTTGGSSATGGVYLRASDGDLYVSSGASRSIRFFSAQSGEATTEQFRISHTASAVNYVQVTGAATGGSPTISMQGSDSSISLAFQSKGSGTGAYFTNSAYPTNNYFSATSPSGIASANRLNAAGAATTFSPVLSTVGSDTNISQVFQSKGTGAIDLAAGSSGVNISNGGTVTAITRTNAGSGYTSKPTVAITAPTTAGGVQAAISVNQMYVAGYTVAAGGSGYTVGDVLTVVGGTQSGGAATLTVATVSAGAVATVTISNAAAYSVLPTNPVSVTGGTGTGATFNLTWAVINFNIDTAGSGYVEQPTVSFSGGGGSGAAAYATVGSGAIIRSLGVTGVSAFDFHGSASASNTVPILRLRDVGVGTSNTGFIQIQNNNGYTQVVAQGPSAAGLNLAANGGGRINLNTQGTNEVTQFRVENTNSAVNFVQVTGAATTGTPIISAQGSDASIPLQLRSKGTFNVSFANGSGNQGFVVSPTGSANYLQATSSNTTIAPSLAAAGTDTNIDLALTPKGTGTVVANGPFTATGQTSLGGASGSEAFRATVVASQNRYVEARGGVSGSTYPAVGVGGGTEAFGIYSNLNILRFNTQGYNTGLQMAVSHTASAVNYVQVTGAATGGVPVISAQGSDASIAMLYQAKGGNAHRFWSSATTEQFRINHTASSVNYGTVAGSAAGSAVTFSVAGTDTNIDLALTPKGTGYVQFGTYTANMALTVQGYIEIKDSSGTVRKLAVIA